MSPSRTTALRAVPGSRASPLINPVITTSCSSANGNALNSGSPINLHVEGAEVSKTYPVRSARAFAGFSTDRLDGSKRQPTIATNTTPAVATTIPTGAKSNMPKPCPSAFSRTEATTILGGVPISVTMPPKIVANDSGIKVTLGLRFALRADSISTGISKDSAATLFITAESNPPTPDIKPIWVATPLTFAMHIRAILSTTPELKRPRLTMSTSAIIIVAGWPNPENACSTGTTPIKTASMSAENATRS